VEVAFLLYFEGAFLTTKKISKIQGAQIQITLEHKCQYVIYRYRITKNR
jgi:hypothetical protein